MKVWRETPVGLTWVSHGCLCYLWTDVCSIEFQGFLLYLEIVPLSDMCFAVFSSIPHVAFSFWWLFPLLGRNLFIWCPACLFAFVAWLQIFLWLVLLWCLLMYKSIICYVFVWVCIYRYINNYFLYGFYFLCHIWEILSHIKAIKDIFFFSSLKVVVFTFILGM